MYFTKILTKKICNRKLAFFFNVIDHLLGRFWQTFIISPVHNHAYTINKNPFLKLKSKTLLVCSNFVIKLKSN